MCVCYVYVLLKESHLLPQYILPVPPFDLVRQEASTLFVLCCSAIH